MRPLAARPHGATVHRAWTLATPGSRRTARGAWVALASTVVWTLGAGTAVAAEVPDATLQVTGTVRIVLPEVVGDGPEGEVRTLVEADGVLHDLTGRPELEGAATGSDVVLTLDADRGVTAEEALTSVAEATGTDTQAPDGTAELVGVTPVEAAPAPSSTGLPRDAAVMGVHTLTVLPVFGGAPDYQTRQTLSDRVQGVAQYWADQTGGRITFSTTVRDWVEYAEPTDCDPDAIWNSALAAHGAVPVSATQHVLVYFPYRSDCGGWAGLASVGGGQIWVNGTPTEDVVAHEIGHNLGLGHANTMACGSGSSRVSLTTSGCSVREYEDRADVMGIGTNMRTGNLTTAAADLLGVLSAQRITTTSVAASVTVDLAPLADVRSVRAVTLPAPGISGGRIYVDFRPQVGRDVRRTAWAGVQVHLRKPDYRGIQQTYLLDMQPSTTNAFSSPALAAGPSWTVPGTSLTVTVHSVGTTARVTVESPSSTPATTTGTTGAGTGSTDTVAPSRAVVTAPASGAVLTGSTVVRWQPSTDTVGVTGYDVVVDGRVVRRVGASTTSTDLGVLAAGPHSVAVDSVDAAGNRARGAAVAFTAVADDVQRYVARVYGDLFHRSPDRAGLLGWAASLSSGTPRVAVANAITASDEYRSRLIQGSYVQYLGRGADGPGLASWLDAMRRGLTIQQMEAGFVASQEYYLQSGSDDARWVTRLYQHVLGRTPAAAEVRHWQRELAAGAGRDRVALGFLLSTEHLTTVVDGHYRDLLGRGIDPTGAAHWVSAIQRGTRVETIVGGIIASEEYGAR